MIWTTSKPTESGWYWYKKSYVRQFVHIERIDDELWADIPHKDYERLANVEGQWAGPIEEPKEPS